MKQEHESDTDSVDSFEDHSLNIFLDDEPEIELDMFEGNPVSVSTSICSSLNSVSSEDICPLPSQTHSEDELFQTLTEEDYMMIDDSVADMTTTPEKKPDMVQAGG